jgi:hypothetical protein
MHSTSSDWALPQPGFPIQTSPDQHLFASSPELFAGYHVFRRLSMPRHPPCTLSSLTTVTDHRPPPLGKTTDVRTAGNGSDHLISTRSHAAYSCGLRPSRQKGARRLPAQNGKDLVSTAGRNRRVENQTPGVADLARPHHAAGDTTTRGLQNLLLNLYSLVKERLISQAPPNAGEQPSDETTGGLVRVRLGALVASAARRPELFQGSRKLAGRDEQHFADQTCATSLVDFQPRFSCDWEAKYIAPVATVKGC